MDQLSKAFLEAAETFAGLLELPEVAARWDEPSAMDGYVVGAVVGHVNTAIAPLEWTLDKPAPDDLKVVRLGRYYAGMKIETADDVQKPIHGGFRDLSNEAAQEGLDANAARFRSLIEQLGKRLTSEEGDRLLDLRPIVPIAIRLDDFVRTRVMELVVQPTISPPASESMVRSRHRPLRPWGSRPSWPRLGRLTVTSASSVPSLEGSVRAPTYSRSSDTIRSASPQSHPAVTLVTQERRSTAWVLWSPGEDRS